MLDRLSIKIVVPIIALMLVLCASLYFVALRTVNEFARQTVEKDLDILTQDLISIVDQGFVEAARSSRPNDQADSLDNLEQNTYSRQFKLIVFEQQTGTIRLASELPGQVNASDVIQRFYNNKDDSSLQIADEKFRVRLFYFSPWDWSFLILKNEHAYSALPQRVHRAYLASALVLLAAAILIVLYLFRSIKTPIDSIVSSLSQGRSPDYRGIQEFEFLCNSIDEMRTTLENEVAECGRAEKAAEQASRAKSAFLANMGHELRTPLNAILGFAYIMEQDETDSSDKESLRIIQRSGKHLLGLIDQIIDLAKIDAGHVTLESNCFDLLHLLADLENMLSPEAVKRDLDLTFEKSANIPRYICTDEIKLRQILLNLLNNAFKFSIEGSVALRITLLETNSVDAAQGDTGSKPLSCPNSDCKLHFEIADTGGGIAQEKIDHFFQVVGKASSDRVVDESTGLGLVVSSRFIELLGGKMGLASKVGKGSVFSFTVPVQVVSKEQVVPDLPESRVIGLEPGQQSYRMLIADDRWDNRKLLVKLLDPFKFEIREAETGAEVLDIMEEWTPHLIWMDIRMPVMDGYETTRKIREDASLYRQPVIIAVTASVFQEKYNTVFECGCDDIIIKPFRGNDVFEKLRKYLKVKYFGTEDALTGEKANTGTGNPGLSHSELHCLPQEIYSKLKKSVAALDMDTTLDVVEEVSKYDESMAHGLRQLVVEYRFDRLQHLLETSEQ